MNKTEAVRAARRAVSIYGSGTSWTVIGPYHRNNISGPSTDVTADSYKKALARSAAWKAEIALGLMGRLTNAASDAIDYEIHNPYGAHTVESLVKIGLAA